MSETLFCTAATADRIDADIGLIWWATNVEGYALEILDYQLSKTSSIDANWIGELLARCAELDAIHKPATRGCYVRVEHPGLINLLKRADEAYRDLEGSKRIDRYATDIKPVAAHEAAKWATTFDERAYAIRPLVDSKKVVKPATGLRRFPWNAVNVNHLAAQLKRHKPGEPASELVGAFTLGVLLGTTRRPVSFFEAVDDTERKQRDSTQGKPQSLFGPYIRGRRPL